MEGVGGHHEGVSECIEVGSITYFFGEDVARVDGIRDVVEIHLLCLNTVSDGTIFEVDMAHALGAGAFVPVNSPLVVVVETGRASGVREVHVVTEMAEGEDILDGLVRGADFGFTGGEACSFLTDRFPGNGTAAAHDDKSAHGAVLEEFNLSAVVDGISNLDAPVCVTEVLERLVRRGSISVSVRFTVVVRGVVKVS